MVCVVFSAIEYYCILVSPVIICRLKVLSTIFSMIIPNKVSIYQISIWNKNMLFLLWYMCVVSFEAL